MPATALDLSPLARKTPRPTISKPVRAAVDRMIFEGMDWQDAAASAGLSTRTMRLALERPATQLYLKTTREVFRASVSSANIHRAKQIRDQDRNQTAAIQAIKYLDDVPDETARGAAARTPGVVIVIGTQAELPVMPQVVTINSTPAYTPSVDAVCEDEDEADD